MLPSQRGQILQQFVINLPAMFTQSLNCLLQVDRIPTDDRCYHHQIQATGQVPLVLKAAISHFVKPIEQHRPGQGILGFSLVQASVDPSSQINILKPIQCEQGSFNFS